MGRLDGKAALVTGGGSGIGAAMSLRFAQEGAAVMVVDVVAQGAAQTAAIISTSSIAGLWGTPHNAAYGASKAAVIMLTKCMAPSSTAV